MSKYKVGDKVVMEITDEISVMEEPNYILSDATVVNKGYIDKAAEPLSTYIEQARAEGQNEAWELVRKIFDMETNDIEDIFIKEDAWNLGTVLNNYTYQEAAARVAEWEKAKEEIKAFMDKLTCDKLSDIISHNNAENKALNNPMYWWAGSVSWRLENMKKTGRHIDIDSFLKQIGGE